jgi:hypothetical protein
MSGEVEYKAKKAMPSLDLDISTLINVLEDIVDKTRLGRTKYRQAITTPVPKSDGDKDSGKKPSSEVQCFVCKKYRHTFRNCKQTIGVMSEEIVDMPTKDSLPVDNKLVIGHTSSGTMVLEGSWGKNNLVAMKCNGQTALVLLDSGAVRTVVGQKYLANFCPDWERFVIRTKSGNFHSDSGTLLPLGVVKVKLSIGDVCLVIEAVVMKNIELQYFILGNDCLQKFHISLLNGTKRQFSIGTCLFLFDNTINIIQPQEDSVGAFEQEVLRESKLGPQLTKV